MEELDIARSVDFDGEGERLEVFVFEANSETTVFEVTGEDLVIVSCRSSTI